uniref:Neur_chan_LBD domain-containing protein n=1 Tax=Angiostrongylus cantonensis TaxID=6313 RepID=A0A158P7G4_ANGCA
MLLRYLLTTLLTTVLGTSKVRQSAKDLEGQLYEDLLFDYNRIPRPVKNSSDILTVDVGASLIRIIDVDEKNQVLTTNLWLEMKWFDAKLTWDPKKYGGLRTLHIPSDLIWTPDLVLYNNAAGDPDITILTDALVTYEGHVFWQPPAIYKSFCPIDVTWFPYDSQKCEMKFGTWTYTGRYVDLKQLPKGIPQKTGTNKGVVTVRMDGNDVEYMQRGMDLSFFYRSAEWDLLSLSSERHSVLYASCCGPEKYVDITYYFGLRRKTLFFTCNLIIPCFLISILTTFVFYLSDHKITFSISILVTLTVFFLVLIDLMPPTSLVIPMFGRYLITTMILVALSTVVSVVTVNFRFRSGSAHKMSPWIRAIFLNVLPKVLFMSRPLRKDPPKPSSALANSFSLTGRDFRKESKNSTRTQNSNSRLKITPYPRHLREKGVCQGVVNNPLDFKRSEGEGRIKSSTKPFTWDRSNIAAPTVAFRKTRKTKGHDDIIFINLLQQVRFIAEHFQHNEKESEISDDWTFVAMVLDRLFLIIFSVLNVGTMFIILEAPSLYDYSEAMNITLPSKPLGQANLYSSHSQKL